MQRTTRRITDHVLSSLDSLENLTTRDVILGTQNEIGMYGVTEHNFNEDEVRLPCKLKMFKSDILSDQVVNKIAQLGLENFILFTTANWPSLVAVVQHVAL